MKNLKTSKLVPSLWLLILIVGLPQLSETIYTPSFEQLVKYFSTSNQYIEWTFSIFLFGFALGTLLWGFLSDCYGRRFGMMAGYCVYLIGTVVCCKSLTISHLMMGRFIQGLGASVGSVLGQAICRDAFSGISRGKVYSTIGTALALTPALGPIVGGLIVKHSVWQNIFLSLIALCFILLTLIYFYLPETSPGQTMTWSDTFPTVKSVSTDPIVLTFAIIIGICNAIVFSYYAEGAFCLISLLEITPTSFGLSFWPIAGSAFIGGMLSKKLHNSYSSKQILFGGINTLTLSSTIFLATTVIGQTYVLNSKLLTYNIIVCMCLLNFSNALIISNALSLSLAKHQFNIGSASAIFGFIYYLIICLLTALMGWLSNHTLITMPAYFFVLGLIIQICKKVLYKIE